MERNVKMSYFPPRRDGKGDVSDGEEECFAAGETNLMNKDRSITSQLFGERRPRSGEVGEGDEGQLLTPLQQQQQQQSAVSQGNKGTVH